MSSAVGFTLGWLALASFVAGAQAQSNAAVASSVPNPSGFLQDYTRLKPVPDKEGRYAWSAPDATLRTYPRFMLAPMEIWIDREAQYRGLAADVVQKLANIYQTAFTQTLAPEFPVVDKPGAGVATCRFAITDVSPQAPRFTPLDVVPVMATFRLIRAATGTSARVARISAEIECQDSVTQALLLEAVVIGVGTERFVEGQPITWPEVEPVFAGWAQDFKGRLMEASGR